MFLWAKQKNDKSYPQGQKKKKKKTHIDSFVWNFILYTHLFTDFFLLPFSQGFWNQQKAQVSFPGPCVHVRF